MSDAIYSADGSLDPITIGETHPVLANPSSGVEASSSASLAAYLNSLQFSVEESQAWFGKGAGWHVSSGVYCCFNAFSRVDVRVDVKIPGGVDAYIVDLRGER